MDVSGRRLELAAMRQYLNRFLDERKAARSRVAEAASADIDPDDTLIIYGYSNMVSVFAYGGVERASRRGVAG